MKKFEKLEIINQHCAGIDVGSRSHFVAIGQDDSQVKEFGVSTPELIKIAHFLRSNGIIKVAMESTGSYFQSLFFFLQENGFETVLIHGGAIKNIAGKKTDVIDCKWIQKLFSLGLVRSCFLPSTAVNEIRTLYRHRLNLMQEAARLLNRMGKSLRLMNVRLDVAINDLGGKTGQKILEAIVAGERDPKVLSSLADSRIRMKKDELELYLQGTWNVNHLYVLGDSFESYKYIRNKIKKCEIMMDSCFHQIIDSQGSEADNNKIELKKKQRSRNALAFNVSKTSYDLFGVDLNKIECVSEATITSFICEIGRDVYKFPSSKKFVSWLRLAPNNKISGGKVISSRTPKSINKFTLTLRNAAQTIGQLKSGYLNSFFKKIAYKKGRGAAITSTARKLAVIIWNMTTKKEDYRPIDMDSYLHKQKLKTIQSMKRKIKQLNISNNELWPDSQHVATC